jgi:multiple sugar transport system substrate-binding protein
VRGSRPPARHAPRDDRLRLRSPTRRDVLKLGAAAGAIAGASGLAGILSTRTAPAYAQRTKLHLLHWVDFIPEGDVELRRQIAEYGKTSGAQVTLETVNLNDLQPRITAAIQSGAGADIIMMFSNWSHLYRAALADVGDLCEWKAKDQGRYYRLAELATRDGRRWLSLPYGMLPGLVAYRKSWFAEAGANGPPKTLEEYRTIGKTLKRAGRPVGQSLGHTVGDAPGWTYSILWAFGGAETDTTGRKVVLRSPATVESVKWMTAFWKDACDEGGLAWDDTNNNRAFHANEISATLNGASIYIFAKRNPDKILDEHGQPMFHDIGHFPIPDGPEPTPIGALPQAHALMKYSKHQAAAKEFLKWLHSKEQFGRWFEIETGYNVGATNHWGQHPLWDRFDPALRAFRAGARGSRLFGYAGPSNAHATEAWSKFIITDMYAKAVQGVAPEEAVAWAARELQAIYER